MYAVIGADGYLGSYLVKTILLETKENVLSVSRKTENSKISARVEEMRCDVTDRESVRRLAERISVQEPVKILYLAAYHHPDLVDQTPKLAWNVNITSLAAFLNDIDNVRCFFYPSTEMVYGNSDGIHRFCETDPLRPVNLYGRHKAAAECLVTTYGYNVVRFPFMIGPSLTKNKKHFYDQIVETIQSGKPMEMFADALKSALDFGTAAHLMVQLAENQNKDMPQILNVSGDEALSKYDIGLRIAKKYDCSKDLIVPISMDQDNKIFETKRAKAALLDNTLLKKVLNLDEIKMKF